MLLVKFLRAFGLRSGWRLYWGRRSIFAEDRLVAARPSFDKHHGRQPDMPGYRRTRRR